MAPLVFSRNDYPRAALDLAAREQVALLRDQYPQLGWLLEDRDRLVEHVREFGANVLSKLEVAEAAIAELSRPAGDRHG